MASESTLGPLISNAYLNKANEIIQFFRSTWERIIHEEFPELHYIGLTARGIEYRYSVKEYTFRGGYHQEIVDKYIYLPIDILFQDHKNWVVKFVQDELSKRIIDRLES